MATSEGGRAEIGLKARGEGDILQKFLEIKRELGVENNPDVIRHLIKVGYEQLVAKAR